MSELPPDLRELLNKPMSEFPDMPDLPARKYFYGKLVGMRATSSRQKETPGYEFSVRLTDPGKDVTKEELDRIAAGGFTLADYNVTYTFWLTTNPGSLRMFRRFVTSLGFPESASFFESLSLDTATGLPTVETTDKIRGLDVLVQTQAAADNGRVYNNLESISGIKRDS